MVVTRNARLNLRLTPADDELIRQAALSTGTTVTQFLSDAAIARAHEVLADQHLFVLDPETWDQFVAVLDLPAQPVPALVELFGRDQQISR